MGERATTLASLARVGDGRVVGDPDRVVTDVVHDSGQARRDVLFVAVRGSRRDGHEFGPAAARAGAALCVDHILEVGADQLVVADTRAALGPLAAEVHGHPSQQLSLVGVTGTNGKTTVTHLLESIVDVAGLRSGLIGTIGARILGEDVATARTTPEASDFQRLLGEMVARSVDVCAAEISSHALALRRVDGARFAVAAFTNLSRDHLDFHHDMEGYYRAKAGLFTPGLSDQAVVWVDDPWGRRLAGELDIPLVAVGRHEGDVFAARIEQGIEGARFELHTSDGWSPVVFRLGGDFNVANALVASACALRVGVPLAAVVAGLQRVERVPGRFDRVDVGRGIEVVVDYAHTPDGITAVIASTRPLVSGRIVVVVGAGGDRDREKRPLMGRAAGSADVVIITSDNPRSEDPGAIAAAVVAGAAPVCEPIVELDRRVAIRVALSAASPGDVVLILGKGHEQGQEFADRVEPFDDRVVALEEAARL